MDMYQLRTLLENEGIIFSFSGTISQSIVSSVVETIEQELVAFGARRTIIHNIFAVLIEQMQNIMSHSRDKVEKGANIYESSGITVVGYDKNKEKYFVSSANVMDSADQLEILKKLDKINTMDSERLKQYYKELRRNGKSTHTRGAGLGFLEMARKSSERLEYHFREINDAQSFFEICVYI
jgi:hypothetical protein